MFYVYILRSTTDPLRSYIGFTSDLKQRLAQHNAGQSIHTNKFKPWVISTYIALPDRALAERLERYLKTGSGRSFAKRQLR
jgi:putative endonuclease